MTVNELAKNSGVKMWKVYYLAKKLGRLPTVEELSNCKLKRGRPSKYKSREE